jgi:hypothetical protein
MMLNPDPAKYQFIGRATALAIAAIILRDPNRGPRGRMDRTALECSRSAQRDGNR